MLLGTIEMAALIDCKSNQSAISPTQVHTFRFSSSQTATSPLTCSKSKTRTHEAKIMSHR